MPHDINQSEPGLINSIEPIKTPRADWFEGYQPEADVEPLQVLPSERDEEWIW